jgi:hypothetical protein
MTSFLRSIRSCWVCSIEGCILVLIGITAVGLAVIGGRSLLGSQTPRIDNIPLLNPGQTQIEVFGRSFGERPGSIWLDSEDAGQQLVDVLAWESDYLSLQLPVGISRGSLKIEQSTAIGKRSSTWHDFITRRAPAAETQTSQVPTQIGSPWPTFRRDARNTGRSPIVAA